MTITKLLLLMAAAVLADQMTKAVALSLLSQGSPIPVLPSFNLTLGFNEGASFGMMGDIMAGKPFVMATLTGALTFALAVTALRAKHPVERSGFALVVGGAIGNIIDRLRQGAVTDFIDLYWRDWHWPTFNVADIAITVGAVMILVASLPVRRRKEPSLDPS